MVFYNANIGVFNFSFPQSTNLLYLYIPFFPGKSGKRENTLLYTSTAYDRQVAF